MHPYPAHRRCPITLQRVLVPAVAAAIALITIHDPTFGAVLDYVDASTGLDTPALDTGRTDLAMVDVDLDGHVDLVSIGDHGSPFIGSPQHGIMVWFGNGAGGFGVVQTGDFGYGGIAIGDVNGDGLNDAAYGMHHNYSGTDLGDQILEVALGDGTGTSWTPWDDGLATSGETWGMFGTDLADVDNDGDLDVGSISFGCCAGVHVYLNQGDGTWVQSWGIGGGNSTMELRFGDVNADGNADLLAAHQSGSVYVGDGEGGFTLADDGLPPAGTIGRRGPDLGDVTGDGADDVSFVTADGGVAVYTRTGTTWQSIGSGLPATGAFRSTRLCDMDGDGHVDLAAFDGDVIRLWRGDGSGGWSADATVVVSSSGDYAAFRTGADLDHNGRPDLVVVVEEGSWPTYQNHLRAYRETSVATALAARVVRPRRGERLTSGSVRFVEWMAAVPLLASARVDLAFSTSGEAGPWQTIATDLPNGGRYQWRVGDTPSSDCVVRATVATPRDTVVVLSDPFTIGEPGAVSVPPSSSTERTIMRVLGNPARDGLRVAIASARPGVHVLELFDVLGRRVGSVPVRLGIGERELTWSLGGDSGISLAPGAYWLRLSGPSGTLDARIRVLH